MATRVEQDLSGADTRVGPALDDDLGWALGTVFRATVRGTRPEVGDRVAMRIRRPLAYPAGN